MRLIPTTSDNLEYYLLVATAIGGVRLLYCRLMFARADRVKKKKKKTEQRNEIKETEYKYAKAGTSSLATGS